MASGCWLAPLIGGFLFPLLWEKSPFGKADIIGGKEPLPAAAE